MSKYCPITSGQVTYQFCEDCDEKICRKPFAKQTRIESANTSLPVKIIVAGGRDFVDYGTVKYELDAYIATLPFPVEIISGGARGADALGERYAMENELEIRRFTAHWNLHGKTAGPIRNEQMAKYASIGNRGALFAFWDGKSHGTKSMIDLARKYKLEVHIIRYKNDTHPLD